MIRGTLYSVCLEAGDPSLGLRKVLCRSCDHFYGWMRQCSGFRCNWCGTWNERPLGLSKETTEDAALDHLGIVLRLLAELSPEDRCQALDEALAFYNAARPDAQIQPNDGWITKLIHIGPMDWPARRADAKC